MSDTLRVYTFSAAWGLPSTGPFALKLMAWLAHVGLPYQQVIENRSARGPLGKSPWIEQGTTRMGDSDAIIAHLARANRLDDPFALSGPQEVCNDALRMAFEERFHQVLEWELFVHPSGIAEMRRMVAEMTPPLIGGLIAGQMGRHFARQLRARGIGRLPPEAVAAIGRRMIDGLEILLARGPQWLGGDGPVLADFAVWGQVAPMLHWPMDTPVARHARSQRAIRDWHSRIMATLPGQRPNA